MRDDDTTTVRIPRCTMRELVYGPARPNPYYDAADDLWCYDTSRSTDAEIVRLAAEHEASQQRLLADIAGYGAE
jgi:hypothetical protein